MLRLSSEFTVNLCSKSHSEADMKYINGVYKGDVPPMIRLRHRGAILINGNGLHSTDGKRITMTEAREALGLYQ